MLPNQLSINWAQKNKIMEQLSKIFMEQVPKDVKDRNKDIYLQEVEKHDIQALERYVVRLEQITGHSKTARQKLMEIKGQF
jgi:hypothetical protein